MTPSFRLVFAAAVLILSAGCHRLPDTDGTDGTVPAATGDGMTAPAPSNGSPAPAPPGDTRLSAYACSDGTRLEAGFTRDGATLQWAEGRRLSLPRAESASKGGGDVYVGDTVSVQRDGASLQLHDGDRAATRCDPATTATAPTTASARASVAGADTAGGAARYACDAGTVLSRNDDGSYRAEVPGNPAVRLTRIAGSEPAVYTGASLYLRIGDGGNAMLSQGDRANELRCSAD